MKPVMTYAPVSCRHAHRAARQRTARRTGRVGPSERGKKKPRHGRPARTPSCRRPGFPTQLIGDDYTSKTTLKVKCAPKSGPPISYTIEDEVKPDGVAGKLTLKYVEPSTGISFDKVTLKGSAYGVEASKTVSGVKCKAKLDPFDVGTLSGSAELKESNFTATCGADSKKIVGSATASPFAGGVLGFSFEYPTGGGALALSAGGSATVQGVFASCIYTSKKVFNFGLMFDATPDITVAATGDSTGQDSACVGLKWMCGSALAGITSLGVKTTTAALSLVAVKKFGKDATLAVSASSKYDAPGAPAYGAQLTIG